MAPGPKGESWKASYQLGLGGPQPRPPSERQPPRVNSPDLASRSSPHAGIGVHLRGRLVQGVLPQSVAWGKIFEGDWILAVNGGDVSDSNVLTTLRAAVSQHHVVSLLVQQRSGQHRGGLWAV